VMRRGKDGPIDSANPGTATIVLNNASGNYDPDNPASPFAGTRELQTDSQPTLNYAQSGQVTASSSGCTNSVVTMQAGGSLHDMGGASASTPSPAWLSSSRPRSRSQASGIARMRSQTGRRSCSASCRA